MVFQVSVRLISEHSVLQFILQQCLSTMVRFRGADSESYMTKLLSTNHKYITVYDKCEVQMSNLVKVTLTSCFE